MGSSASSKSQIKPGSKTADARLTFEHLEAQLAEMSELNEGLLQMVPFPVTVSSVADGRFLLVNESFCQICGYVREEVIGCTTAELGIYLDPGERQRIIETLYRNSGRLKHFDSFVRGKDSPRYHNRISAKIIRHQGQDCLLTMSSYRSSLTEAQQALRQSELRFKNILDSITESYFEVDLAGNFTFFNESVPKLLGYSPDELRGMNYKVYTPPEHARKVNKAFNEVFRGASNVRFVEYGIQRKDRTMVLVEASASVLRNSTGQPIGFYGLLRDRTVQKMAEEALRRSEESYRGILELAPDAISIGRIEDGRYLEVNNAFCRLTGYSAAETIGRTALELNLYVNSEDRQRMLETMHRNGQVQAMEIQFRLKSGEIIDALVSARQISFRGMGCLLVIVTNITTLKKAQADLRQNKERFRDIIETMEEGYYEVDTKGSFTFFNAATLRLHGHSLDELMGMNYKQYIASPYLPEVRRRFIQMYQTGTPDEVMEYEIVRKDGTLRTIEMSAYPLKSSDNQTIGFWGITRDRTEKKKVQMDLQKSEEMYRLLVNNANDGVYITQQGRIEFHNPKMATITGYADQDLIQMDFAQLVHPEDREVVYQAHQHKLAQGKDPEVFSFRILNKSQEEVWVELNAIGITWMGKPAALNFLRDVTLQKRIEAQLLQARKMEAVGTLAGGIAHDFNNLLMGIKGNITIAMMDLSKENPIYEKLSAIEQYVKAGADLTKQLLGTARGGKYEAKPTDLNQLVDTSAELFGRTKKEVRIHRRFEKELWTVEVDRGQIEQVLLNLFVNAWQAMPNGGDLYLETQNVTLNDFDVKAYGVAPGKFAKLILTDTGIGIEPQNLKRIFDPFFTTKSVGIGTGLGLSSAYGIISNHGGIITVYSEPGAGATFNIYLPASSKKLVEAVEPKKAIVKGHETLLFVDDEKGIVEVGCLLLQRLGYKVIVAHDGEQAVEIYRQQQDKIDLVIVDMIMPGMSGSDTFSALRAINPKVKIILSSGYSVNGQARSILDKGCNGFIQKPFSMQDISSKLREVLSSKNTN
ncbi:MAG: PAS domain S-box protein [Desulfobacteraceae bacterium]|nr:PAS domain S-box protein [Desulfobacteraceae bacterium]